MNGRWKGLRQLPLSIKGQVALFVVSSICMLLSYTLYIKKYCMWENEKYLCLLCKSCDPLNLIICVHTHFKHIKSIYLWLEGWKLRVSWSNFSISKPLPPLGFTAAVMMYCTFKNLSRGVRIADTEHLLKVDCPEIMDS